MKARHITGIGVLSSLGVGVDDTLAALRAWTMPAQLRPTSFEATADAPILEVPGFDPTRYLGDKGLRTLDRLTKLLVVAARLALHDAGLKNDNAWIALAPEQVGVCCSNAYGSLEAITELDRVAVLEDARYINPAKFPNTVSNSASGYVSIWEDLRALNVSVSDGNCGGLDAASCADMFLATNRAEAILTGGGEAMSNALFVAFERLGVLGPDSKLGEGAAFLVLEAGPREKQYGTISGYGTSFVAPSDEVTLLFASRVALERAISSALADAGVTEVDLVVSGLSGIPQFDDEERAAIAKVLGSDVAVAAPKQLFGETLGADGVLGIIAALAWLGDGSPSLVSGNSRPTKTVLVTSVGYYGNASAIVVSAT